MPHARDDRRDRELLCDLASGRREALGELYDRHSASLFRHGLALTRRAADAEDLVQSVFVKLATTGAELLGVRTPASYLHRILSTTWLDSQRRTVAGERAVEIGKMDLVESHPFGLEGAIDIGRALDALPDAQREAVVLHVFDGFSFREVGRATGQRPQGRRVRAARRGAEEPHSPPARARLDRDEVACRGRLDRRSSAPTLHRQFRPFIVSSDPSSSVPTLHRPAFVAHATSAGRQPRPCIVSPDYLVASSTVARNTSRARSSMISGVMISIASFVV